MSYVAPLQDMLFVMNELAGLQQVAQLPDFTDATADTVSAILEENSRFVREVIAPLNRVGDTQPPTYADGKVTTSPGFKEAFRQFTASGWQGLAHSVEHGGGGLPKLVAAACMEMLNAANLSFALCPLLTDGAIEALMTAGSEEQQNTYVPPLIEGRWTGTMNLTEPEAGSDLSLIRTQAVEQEDGRYRLVGQKIFITFGEHDMAENIIHMVLARRPDAPPGIKGLSLFIVPKILQDGTRNDVYCASLEHKLGIKASPTAVLLFGQGKHLVDHQAGAVGYLMGEKNRGLEYMFVMMNAARFAVGIQGVAVAERAYQQAVKYAKERVQSRDVAGSAGAVSIIHHPDVKRMLLFMRAHIEAVRALAYWAAAQCDIGRHHPDQQQRQQATAYYEYCVPVIKGCATEMAVDVCSMALQVHGGMGFIEETGVAQYYRDARILTIYEGTTAIQANDLISRKTLRDNAATVRALSALIEETEQQLVARTQTSCQKVYSSLRAGRQAWLDAVAYVLDHAKTQPTQVFAGSVPYLKLTGLVLGGWQMARAMLASEPPTGKSATAEFFAVHLLSQAHTLRDVILQGGEIVAQFSPDNF